MAVNKLFYTKFIHTKAGTFQAVATEKGLFELRFPGRCYSLNGVQDRIPPRVLSIFRKTQKYLSSIFAHQNHIQQVAIDWSRFKPFERSVLKALCHIPSGRTVDYGELARRAGHPRAAHAVGNALSRNPIPILIPCHRVIRKEGTLGGYSGGLGWKKKLLKLEGITFRGRFSKCP